jgi:hypothetical protein
MKAAAADATSSSSSNPYDEAPIKPMRAAAGATSSLASNPYDEAPIKPMKAGAADATSKSPSPSNPYDEAPIKPMKAGAADATSSSNPYDEAPIKPMKAAAVAYDDTGNNEGVLLVAASAVRKSSLIKSSAFVKSRLELSKEQVTAVEEGGIGDVKIPLPSKGTATATGKPGANAERGPDNRPKTELTVEGASSEGGAAVPVLLTVECPDQGCMHRVVSSSTMSSMDSGMRQCVSGMHEKEKNVLSDVSPLASPVNRDELPLSAGMPCSKESGVCEDESYSLDPYAGISAAAISSLNGDPLSGGDEGSWKSSQYSAVASATPSCLDSPASFEAARKHFIKPRSKANEGEADCSDGWSKTPSPARVRENSVVVNGSIISLLEKFNGSGNRRQSDERQAGPPPLFDLGEVSPDRTLPSVVKKTRVLGTSRSPSRNSSVPDTYTNTASNDTNMNMNMSKQNAGDVSDNSSVASVSSSVFVSASDGSVSHPPSPAPCNMIDDNNNVEKQRANKHQNYALPDFTSFSHHSDSLMPSNHKEIISNSNSSSSSSRSSGVPNRSSVICGESDIGGEWEKNKSDSDLRQSIGRSNSNSNSNSNCNSNSSSDGNSKIKSEGSYHDAGKSLQLRSSMSPFAHAKPDISPEWLSMSVPMSADTSSSGDGSGLSQDTASLLDNDLDDLLYKSLDLGLLKALRLNTNTTTILTRTRTESMLAFVSER